MLIILKNKDTLHYKDFSFKCTIGKKGLTSNQIESDKKTPTGNTNLFWCRNWCHTLSCIFCRGQWGSWRNWCIAFRNCNL